MHFSNWKNKVCIECYINKYFLIKYFNTVLKGYISLLYNLIKISIKCDLNLIINLNKIK